MRRGWLGAGGSVRWVWGELGGSSTAYRAGRVAVGYCVIPLHGNAAGPEISTAPTMVFPPGLGDVYGVVSLGYRSGERMSGQRQTTTSWGDQ